MMLSLDPIGQAKFGPLEAEFYERFEANCRNLDEAARLVIESIERTERITAADLAITINTR